MDQLHVIIHEHCVHDELACVEQRGGDPGRIPAILDEIERIKQGRLGRDWVPINDMKGLDILGYDTRGKRVLLSGAYAEWCVRRHKGVLDAARVPNEYHDEGLLYATRDLLQPFPAPQSNLFVIVHPQCITTDVARLQEEGAPLGRYHVVLKELGRIRRREDVIEITGNPEAVEYGAPRDRTVRVCGAYGDACVRSHIDTLESFGVPAVLHEPGTVYTHDLYQALRGLSL